MHFIYSVYEKEMQIPELLDAVSTLQQTSHIIRTAAVVKAMQDCSVPKYVKVLPEFVTPYVKTREFPPSRTSLTKSFTVPSNSSFCVVCGPYTFHQKLICGAKQSKKTFKIFDEKINKNTRELVFRTTMQLVFFSASHD